MFWYVIMHKHSRAGGPEPSVKQPPRVSNKYDTCIDSIECFFNEQLLPTNKNFNGEENGKELNRTAIEKNGEKLTDDETPENKIC